MSESTTLDFTYVKGFIFYRNLGNVDDKLRLTSL